jgi:PQQ-like domain
MKFHRSLLLTVVALATVAGYISPRILTAAEPKPVASPSRLDPTNANFDLRGMHLRALWRSGTVLRKGDAVRKIHNSGTYITVETKMNHVFLSLATNGRSVCNVRVHRPLRHGPLEIPESANVLITMGDAFLNLDTETGTLGEPWRAGASPYAPPVVLKDRIVIADASGRMTVSPLTPDTPAKKYWTQALHGPIDSRPVLLGDMIVGSAIADRAFALNTITGSIKWSWKPDRPVRITSGVAVVGEHVFVGDNRGQVYALSLDSGESKGLTQTDACVVGTPRVAQGKLFFLTSGPSLCQIKPEALPSVVWEYPGAVEIVAIGKKTVYVLTNKHEIAAVAIATGKAVWKDALPKGAVVTTDVDEKGLLFCVAAATGSVAAFVESD